jgi:hypothetical protein
VGWKHRIPADASNAPRAQRLQVITPPTAIVEDEAVAVEQPSIKCQAQRARKRGASNGGAMALMAVHGRDDPFFAGLMMETCRVSG